MLVARKCQRAHRASATRIGLPGRLSTRLQPNHPTDDAAGIAASLLDGLLYGSGDAVIGINPATDNVPQVMRLLQMLDARDHALRIPTQSCVLTHVTNTLQAIERGAPVDLVFQSIGGTEATNTQLRHRPGAAGRGPRGGAVAASAARVDGARRHVMYFETGQGSALSANAHHGCDQQTSRRAPTRWRATSSRCWSTRWSASSGRSTCTTASRSCAPGWKTTSAASCWACRWAATSATPTMPRPTRTTWTCC